MEKLNNPSNSNIAAACEEVLENLVSNCRIFSFDSADSNLKSFDWRPCHGPHIHESWEFKLIIGPEPYSVFERQMTIMPPALILVRPKTIHGGGGLADYGQNKLLAMTLRDSRAAVGYLGNYRFSRILDESEMESLKKNSLSSPEHIFSTLDAFAAKDNEMSKNSYPLSLTRLFLASLIQVFKAPDSAGQRDSRQRLDIVDKALQFIAVYYYRSELTVKEIAAHSGVSSGHLSMIFKKRMNLSVRQHLIQTRLENAREMLINEFKSVKEVSYLTGWNDQLYFSRCFRQHFGHPPSRIGT